MLLLLTELLEWPLERLDEITGVDLTDINLKELAQTEQFNMLCERLKACVNLQELNLSNINLNPIPADAIKALFNSVTDHKKLTKLVLSQNALQGIANNFLGILEGIKQLKHLKILDLSKNDLGLLCKKSSEDKQRLLQDAGFTINLDMTTRFKLLMDCLSSSSLEELDLSYNKLTFADGNQLKDLGALSSTIKTLKKINISNNEIDKFTAPKFEALSSGFSESNNLILIVRDIADKDKESFFIKLLQKNYFEQLNKIEPQSKEAPLTPGRQASFCRAFENRRNSFVEELRDSVAKVFKPALI